MEEVDMPANNPTNKDKRYMITHASMWSIVVVLGMVTSFLLAWSLIGIVTWILPEVAALSMFSVGVLAATLFSIARGGHKTKSDRDKDTARSHSPTPLYEDKKYMTVHATMWVTVILIGMASSFLCALTLAGAVQWIGTAASAYSVLATLVLAATLFTIAYRDGSHLPK